MTPRKTRLTVGAVVVGVLGLGVALVLLVDFSSPRLEKATLDEASKASGLRLSATAVHFNLIRGLVLDEVESSIHLPGGRLEAHLQQLVLETRLLPLLVGKVVVSAVAIKRPRLKLVGSRGQSASRRRATGEKDRSSSDGRQTSASPTAGFDLNLEIEELRIEDGAVILSADGGGVFPSMRGIGCQLRNLDFTPGALSPLHGLSAVGAIQVEEIAFPSRVVRDLRGRIEAEGGRFRLDDLGFLMRESPFRATMSVDFNRIPFGYTLSLAGGPMDLAALVGSVGRGGLGPAVLELEAEGFGSSSKNMKGMGRLILEPGTLPSFPILVGIEEALHRDGLVGGAYGAAEAAFRLEEDEIIWEPFQLDTNRVRLTWSGSAGLDGRLTLRIIVETALEGLEVGGVAGDVLDALTTQPGRVALPFRVTGTIDDPRIGLDTDALSSPVVETEKSP